MKKTIAIVSSDVLFPKLIEQMVEKRVANLQIILCKSKQEIEEKMNVSSTVLTILDSALSGVSGLEIMRFLRNEKQVKSPIWFFTEIQTESYTYKSYVMGATHVINKPFDPYAVTDSIAELLLPRIHNK